MADAVSVTQSRALVLSLLLALGLLGALGSRLWLGAGEMQEGVRRLSDEVLAADSLVRDSAKATSDVLDAFEAMVRGDAGTEPGAVRDFLALLNVEAQLWTAAGSALDDVDASQLRKETARLRDDVWTLINERADQTSLTDRAATTFDATGDLARTVRLRKSLHELSTAVDKTLVSEQVDAVAARSAPLQPMVGVGFAIVFVLLGAATAVAIRTTTRAARESARSAFEAKVMRALEFAKTETTVLGVVQVAMSEVAAGAPAEILVADESRAHFRRVPIAGGAEFGCDVTAPLDCPATSSGQTAIFADDSSIDTCPHLRGRACSAVCVPVSIYGQTTGVVFLNDRHGHDMGDRAIRLFAGVLREAIRPDDLASRYGGEEFIVLLPRCGAEEAQAILERVQDRLTKVLADSTTPSFTCSFGVAVSADGSDPEGVIAAADAALSQAKASGRDRIVWSIPGHPGDHDEAHVLPFEVR